MSICLLNLANKDLTDSKLAENLRVAPSNAIILLEDVDAVFVDRTGTKDGGRSEGVTFSGLLNALDGVGAQEGRIFMVSAHVSASLPPPRI
jgi:chaperone BCS1